MKTDMTTCSSCFLRSPGYRTHQTQKADIPEQEAKGQFVLRVKGAEAICATVFMWQPNSATVVLHEVSAWRRRLFTNEVLTWNSPQYYLFRYNTSIRTVAEHFKPLTQNPWGPWLKSRLGDLLSWQVSRGTTQSLQVNARSVPKLGYEHFLPLTSEFIIHLSSHCWWAG
jgi:hypothetical protein